MGKKLSKQRRSHYLNTVEFLLIGLLFLASLLSYSSGYFSGTWQHRIELFSHFRAHYLVLWLMLSVKQLYHLSPVKLAISCVGLIISSIHVVPLYFSPRYAFQAGHTDTLSISSINVLRHNDRYDMVDQYAQTYQPDILILLETTSAWEAGLSGLIDHYEDKHLLPLEDYYGIIVLSQFPILSVCEYNFTADHVPLLQVNLELPHGQVNVFAAHPPSPPSPRKMNWRNEQLSQLGRLLGEQTEPVILIGDLNTTSFSPIFTQLMGSSDLYDSRRGWGRQATWPAHLGQWGITLDHALLSPNIETLHREVGELPGSDHLPIHLRLVVHHE